MDASVNMLPYVYDTFRWDHCRDAGIDFDEAWEATSGAKKTKKTGSKSTSRPSFEGSELLGPASFRGIRKATGKGGDSKGRS